MVRTLAIAAIVSVALIAPARAETETGTIKGTLVSRAGKRLKKKGVVYLQPAPGTKLPKRKDKRAKTEIVQKDKKFMPGWVVVTKGTWVAFPNDDTRDHNVFSNTKGNKFDLDEYRPGKSKSAKMRKVGVVDIQCNIHPEMAATVLVVPNDYYAESTDKGSWVLDEVPAGTYTVNGYIPALRREGAIKVTVEAGKTAEVELPMSKTGKKPKLDKTYKLPRLQ